MSDSPKPAVLNNNIIPNWPIFAFGGVFLLVLLALPFVVTRCIDKTAERSHAITLLDAAGVIVDTSRATVSDDKDNASLVGRFPLGPADTTELRKHLATAEKPPADWVHEMLKIAAGDSTKAPGPDATGPWRTASGVKDGLHWRAILDEGSGTLWMSARRPGAEPVKK